MMIAMRILKVSLLKIDYNYNYNYKYSNYYALIK